MSIVPSNSSVVLLMNKIDALPVARSLASLSTMAIPLLRRRTSQTLTLTLGRLLHPYSPLHPVPIPTAASLCLHFAASHPTIQPSYPRSAAPRADLSRSFSAVTGVGSIHRDAAKISGYDSISWYHPYTPSLASMQVFPRWFSANSQEVSAKQEAPVAQSHVKENNNTAKTSTVLAFSPLEGVRSSGLRSESLKVRRMELSQKLTYALIPALLIISKTKLTTSLLILSVYWQIYGFFKEIFLDYVHQEVTRKWVLIYLKLLLLILAKETFLDFNMF